MNTIDKETQDIFNQSVITENKVILPNVQLERNLYLKVNQHLDNCGGKWNRKEKAHIFSNGTNKLKQSLDSGKTISVKKEFHAFYTPDFISKELIELANLNSKDIILEPSAGEGNLIKNIIKFTENIVAVEINQEAYQELKEKFNDIVIYNQDFLLFRSDIKFDKVIMNPPFNKNEWVKHIKHCFSMLKDNGEIFAIIPDALHNSYFKKHILENGIHCEFVKRFENAFEGTKINVLMVKFYK